MPEDAKTIQAVLERRISIGHHGQIDPRRDVSSGNTQSQDSRHLFGSKGNATIPVASSSLGAKLSFERLRPQGEYDAVDELGESRKSSIRRRSKSTARRSLPRRPPPPPLSPSSSEVTEVESRGEWTLPRRGPLIMGYDHRIMPWGVIGGKYLLVMRLGLGRQGDGRHTTSIVTLIPSKTATYGTIITKGLSNDVDYESDSQVPLYQQDPQSTSFFPNRRSYTTDS